MVMWYITEKEAKMVDLEFPEGSICFTGYSRRHAGA